MFDAKLRPLLNPALDAAARTIIKTGVSANIITLFGAILGLAAGIAIAQERYGLGIMLILANRILDGIDGRVAKIKGPTEFGGYLDSLCDHLFYVAVPVGFGMSKTGNLPPSLLLVAAFTLTAVSFLALAAILARTEVDDGAHGPKAFIYSTGLMEGAETIVIFITMCLFPQYYAALAYAFAALCMLTICQRILSAWQRLN
jgi:phosphatidylglycerophosphate synthase